MHASHGWACRAGPASAFACPQLDISPNDYYRLAKKFGVTTKKIFSLSSDLSSAKSIAAGTDLMTVPYQNYASDTDTNFNQVLTDMNSEISNPGDGSTSVAPQKVLLDAAVLDRRAV